MASDCSLAIKVLDEVTLGSVGQAPQKGNLYSAEAGIVNGVI